MPRADRLRGARPMSSCLYRVGQIAALAAARRYSHRIQDMEGPLLMSSGGTTIRAVLFLATLSQPDTPPSRSPYYQHLLWRENQRAQPSTIARRLPVILRNLIPWQGT